MTTTFYITRHALAVKKGEEYGERVLTAEILPEGISAIEKMGSYLKDISFDYAVCSPILRCQQTAVILTRYTNKPFVTDHLLREYHEETFQELGDRTTTFLEDIKEKNYKNVLICTHGSVISALQYLITTNHFTPEERMRFPDSGILTIIQNKIVNTIDFNTQ